MLVYERETRYEISLGCKNRTEFEKYKRRNEKGKLEQISPKSKGRERKEEREQAVGLHMCVKVVDQFYSIPSFHHLESGEKRGRILDFRLDQERDNNFSPPGLQ